jgi:hypothetical protein
MLRLNNRGQSLTELAIYLAVVIAVILAMRLYIQRSFQSKYRAGADYLFTEIEGNAADKGISGFSGIKRQYDPYYRESSISEAREGESTIGFPESSTKQTVKKGAGVGSGSWEKTSSALDAD